MWFGGGKLETKHVLFSTHPTPRTTLTGQCRALTVCKDVLRVGPPHHHHQSSPLFLRFTSHLIVTGDGNVHVSQWRISIAQGNGGDVDIGSLSQWLMVSTGISHNQEAGLPESCLDLISECTRGESTVERGGTGSGGKLQHSPLKWKENQLRSHIL